MTFYNDSMIDILKTNPAGMLALKRSRRILSTSGKSDISAALTPRPTCLDGVFESRPAADQDIVQGRRLVLQLPVVELQQLVRVMKINNFGFPVERLHDVGQ